MNQSIYYLRLFCPKKINIGLIMYLYFLKDSLLAADLGRDGAGSTDPRDPQASDPTSGADSTEVASDPEDQVYWLNLHWPWKTSLSC